MIIIIILIIFVIIISGTQSFYSCTQLTQIILTSGLTQISPGTGIFGYSTAVTSLTVPSTVTAMGERDIIIITVFY